MSSETQAPAVAKVSAKNRDYERWFRTLDGHLRVLERERQKLSAIVNHADAGFLVVDRSRQIVWANRVFCEKFAPTGNAPRKVVGEACNRMLCRKASPCDDCPAMQPFDTASIAHGEMRLWLRDRHHFIYATAMPIQGIDGTVDQTIVMLQDVSDLEVLRQSEEALRTSEQRFRLIFERMTSGMATCRADGTFLQVNPALCTMLGYTEKELLPRTILDITQPEDLAESLRELDEVKTGVRRVIETQRRYLRRDGTTVWGQTMAVWQFENDQPQFAIVIIQDISERKRALEELSKSRRKYEELVDSIDGIAWEADASTLQFLFVSKQVVRILGYPMERWLSQPRFWRNRIHRDDLDRVIEAFNNAVKIREGGEVEYRLTAADGRPVWVRDRFSVVEEQGEVVRLRGIMIDVSDRRSAEAALEESEERLRQSQKMDAVGRLAGGIAHDFNNLLTAITGYNDFLLKQLGEGHKLHREATEIKKAARRASALTNQLLAFSRQQVLMPQVLDLNAVVADMEEMLRRVIGEDVELVVAKGDDLGAVKADPGQLQQVLLNLAVNGRDAMPDGGRLTIQTSSVELTEDYTSYHEDVSPGHYVVLAISDTGCGMDEETKVRLFEPFFTTKDTGKGTGLGLSTVYGIVKQSGGHIAAYSELGKGSTFLVYLPWVDEKPPVAKELAEEETAVKKGSERILLVEDDEAVRELTKEILQMNGYSVIAASGGPEALEICEHLQQPIGLMVTDLVMPQIGGRELAKALGKRIPGLRVLYMSGYTTSTSLQQGLLEPGASFLQKPFTPEEMARKVREILDADP